MVYQGQEDCCSANSAIAAGTFPDGRSNSRDAQSLSTQTNALHRGKGYGAAFTVHGSDSEGGDDDTVEEEPTLLLRWTLQGQLGTTEQALQAAEAFISAESLNDNGLLLEQAATSRLVDANILL